MATDRNPTTVLTNGAWSIINPTQERISQHAYMRILTQKTEQWVRDNGRLAKCLEKGCRAVVGRECPPNWCEGIFHQIRKDLVNV